MNSDGRQWPDRHCHHQVQEMATTQADLVARIVTTDDGPDVATRKPVATAARHRGPGAGLRGGMGTADAEAGRGLTGVERVC